MTATDAPLQCQLSKFWLGGVSRRGAVLVVPSDAHTLGPSAAKATCCWSRSLMGGWWPWTLVPAASSGPSTLELPWCLRPTEQQLLQLRAAAVVAGWTVTAMAARVPQPQQRLQQLGSPSFPAQMAACMSTDRCQMATAALMARPDLSLRYSHQCCWLLPLPALELGCML